MSQPPVISCFCTSEALHQQSYSPLLATCEPLRIVHCLEGSDGGDVQNELEMDASDKRVPKVDVAGSTPEMAPAQGIHCCLHGRLEITYMLLSPYRFSNKGQTGTNILLPSTINSQSIPENSTFRASTNKICLGVAPYSTVSILSAPVSHPLPWYHSIFQC